MADDTPLQDMFGPNDTGAAPAPGAAAPNATAGAPPAKPAAPAGPLTSQFGPNELPPAPAPEPAPPPSKAHVASMALASSIDQLVAGGGKLAGGVAVLGDQIRNMWSAPENQKTTLSDWWFKHAVDPWVEREAGNQLGPDATTADKAVYGVTNMAAMIAQYFIGVGEAELPEAAAALPEVAQRVAAHVMTAGGAATVPAASDAIEVGQSVLDSTGNKQAAAKAAAMSYLVNSATAMGPAAIGRGFLPRVASGAGIGFGLGQAGRVAQNAVMPEDQQQGFDPLNAAIQTIGGAGFGAAVHITAPAERPLVHAPEGVVEMAERHAAEVSAEAGGDALDQTVAATQAGAGVGGVHDAAAVHGAREAEEQHQATAMELRRQQAMQADADAQADIEQGQREQGLNQAEAAKAPETTPEQGFEQAESAKQSAKEADYAKAKNQVGDQEVEASKTADVGAEKGGSNEPKPTLADVLPPEQVSALQALRAQRAAAPEPTVQERMQEQAKGTPEDFKPLPEEPAQPPTEAQEPEEEEPAPTPKPPPVTAQTLAQRRQAALDEAMAKKVGGENPPFPGEEPVRQTAVQPPAASEEAPAAPPVPEKAPPNRLAAIRAAAEKAQAKKTGFVASTDEQLARYAERAAAKRKGEEPPVKASDQPENDWFTNRVRQAEAMPHEEAKEHLSDFSAVHGKRDFQIHESTTADTIPPDLRRDLDAYKDHTGQTSVKGVFYGGKVHVFADAHQAGNGDDIRSTAVHELAHKGLNAILGDQEYAKTMDGIYASVKDTAWAKRLVQRRAMNTNSIDSQRLVAEEYAAHMAENVAAGRVVHQGLPVKDATVGHWQRVVDSVRGALRKVGIVKHWNDNDIAALIRQANTAMHDPSRMAREGAQYKDSQLKASLANDDENMERLYPPDHPLAVGHKMARTVEEQGNYNPGFVKSAETLVRDMGEGKPDALLGGIGLRNIPDFIRPESMPSAHAFIEDHDAMEGRRRQILNPTIDRAREWSQWQAKQEDRGEKLSELMHAFTLTGHAADRPYQERYTAEERAADPEKAKSERYHREVNRDLQRQFNELDPQARQLYKNVRDDYTNMRTQTLKGIEDRIQASGADEQTKKNAMSSLRKAFESGQVKGDYFPLQRFGDLWANAKDKEGNTVSFSRFESRTQRKQWLAEQRKAGYDVDSGEAMHTKSEMERIAPDFVKNVMGHVEAADPSGKLAQDIWQEYLKAMPEMSMRKHMISRVGRLGFSGDALRAYAFNMFHGAHQLARLEYGNKLDTRMEGIKEEARNLEQKGAQNPDDKLAQSDAKWAPAIAREMQQRYDWLRNPRSSKLASAMTRFGFSWYLGAAPATAFRIFSQNPMLAAPMLAKHFGWFGASKELGAQTMKWAKSMGMKGYRDNFRGDEARAYDEADQRGVFSDTNTQTMAAGGDGSPLFKGPWYQFQKYAGYMFNAMEHHNRATTLMSAYRLGRTKGMDHDDASKLARKITWDSHFDYTNANRPRYLQGNVPKVIGLFKQYSLGVTYRLAREGADMINRTEKTPQERAQAAVALSSLIGRMMMFAGVTGVPGYWIAEKVVNSMMGDDDKPYDMTAALHKNLQDTMGTTAADSIMTGPVGAVTGASLSSGASYNDLWYKPSMREEEPQQQVYDAMGQLLGPIGALPINAAQGVSQMGHGNIERGLEHFLPPEAAALAKSVRYATQGATNTKGQNILPKDQQIDSRDVFLQSIGFTPQKVADAQRRNAAIKNIEKTITDRKELLSGQYESALLTGDKKTAADTWTKIQAFNKANPEAAIGPGLAAGTLGLAKRNATSQQGIAQTPITRNLQKEY